MSCGCTRILLILCGGADPLDLVAVGLEDFVACEKNNVEMKSILVDDAGCFTDEVGHGCAGLPVLGDGASLSAFTILLCG